MLVVVLSLLDKQDLPAAGLSLCCFLEGELGEALEPQGAAGPGQALATLWHSVCFEVICVPSVVGNKISHLQHMQWNSFLLQGWLHHLEQAQHSREPQRGGGSSHFVQESLSQ